jgi:hypothetical protein
VPRRTHPAQLFCLLASLNPFRLQRRVQRKQTEEVLAQCVVPDATEPHTVCDGFVSFQTFFETLKFQKKQQCIKISQKSVYFFDEKKTQCAL